MLRLIRFIFALAIVCSLEAQSNSTSTLRGQVMDESGAVVPGALVSVTLGKTEKHVTADTAGQYAIGGLTPGKYSVVSSANNQLMMQPLSVVVAGAVTKLDLKLSIKAVEESVTVQDSAAPVVSTDSASNASGLVMKGDALEALSDDPDDLAADLQALAGPSAGPSGGSIYIDGFSGGDIPPKSSIREIRVNQNPFSPEFDKLGYGRVR